MTQRTHRIASVPGDGIDQLAASDAIFFGAVGEHQPGALGTREVEAALAAQLGL